MSHSPSTRVTRSAETAEAAAGPAGPHGRVRALLTGLLVLAATLAGLCVAVTPAQAQAIPAGPPLGYLSRHVLSDPFDRTIRSGWGSAPLGGAYQGVGTHGRAMAISGNAYFNDVDSGHARAQRSSVTATDMLASVSVAIPWIPRRGSWGSYVGIELREQSDGRAYTATLRIGDRGQAWLLVDRRPVRGVSTRLTSRTLPNMAAGRAYVLQAAVVGTQVWARIYRAGTRPSAWLTAKDTSRSALRGAGRTGIVLATTGLRAKSSAHFGSLNVWSPARVVSPPAPPSSTPPSSTPPSSTPPSSTPPSSTPPSSTPPSTTPPGDGSSHADQVIADAGSAPLGSTSYAVPANAIIVSPSGDDSYGNGTLSAPYATVGKALSSATSGRTIVLRGGSYHESVYIRSSLQVTIQSYPGETVWFDGSVPVSGWTQRGSDWVHSGWTAQFDHSASFTKGSNAGGFVNSAYPMAAWPDQVFVDGVQLQQVAANPSAGEFAVDYADQQLIVGSDPSGHAVRASDLSQAFVVAGQATLRGFGIRRYATSLPQMGTLFIGGNGGNLVQNVIVDNSAGQGLATASANNVVDHVTITANGMTGISAAYSDNMTVENSLISGNNTQNFNAAPSAGGLKAGRLDGIVIRDNLVEDNNDIAGLWTDENVTHFTITGNVVRDNGYAYGILNELSATGIVANNVVSGSKYGITAFDSGDIEIYNNDVDNNLVWDIGLTQDNRWQPGKGTAGPRVQPSPANPWLVRNIVVANNNFGRANGMLQFYVLDKQTNRPANSMNLMVAGNQFAPRTNPAQPWAIGWGMGDNTTVHTYSSPGAFNAGEQKNWPNAQAGVGIGYASASAAVSVAQPLPSDVAAAIGQSVGVKHVGTF